LKHAFTIESECRELEKSYRIYRWGLRGGNKVLVQDVQLLSAGELDLIRAAMSLGALDARSVLADARNFSLRKRPRVVLMQGVAWGLPIFEDAVV